MRREGDHAEMMHYEHALHFNPFYQVWLYRKE